MVDPTCTSVLRVTSLCALANCLLKRLPIIAGSDLSHLIYRTWHGSTPSSSLEVICQAALSVFRNLEVLIQRTLESRDMLSSCLKTRHSCWISFLCHHPLFQIMFVSSGLVLLLKHLSDIS